MTGPVSMRDERGVAVLGSTVLIGALVLVAALAALLGSVAVTRARTAAVADLAAVSAARTGACTQPRAVAEQNGMTMVQCERQDADMLVRVSAPLPPLARRWIVWLGGELGGVEAVSRAGFVAPPGE